MKEKPSDIRATVLVEQVYLYCTASHFNHTFDNFLWIKVTLLRPPIVSFSLNWSLHNSQSVMNPAVNRRTAVITRYRSWLWRFQLMKMYGQLICRWQLRVFQIIRLFVTICSIWLIYLQFPWKVAIKFAGSLNTTSSLSLCRYCEPMNMCLSVNAWLHVLISSISS